MTCILKKSLLMCLICVVAMTCRLKADEAPQHKQLEEISAAFRDFERGDTKAAIAALDRVLASDPDNVAAMSARAQIYEKTGDFPQALADYDHWVKLQGGQWQPYNQRGAARFKAGDVAGSIADFDRAIKINPPLERQHWQRGLSHYYARRFRDGDKQFGLYQTYYAADVENVVWRMACQARYLGFEKARQGIMKLEGPDRRVPMKQIDALFRGTGTVEQVLEAAQAGDPDEKTLRQQLFYAHLYLGLYHEIKGEAKQARQHIFAADSRKISHYMWDVAHVHADLLRQEAAATKAATSRQGK